MPTVWLGVATVLSDRVKLAGYPGCTQSGNLVGFSALFELVSGIRVQVAKPMIPSRKRARGRALPVSNDDGEAADWPDPISLRAVR